MYTDNYKYKLSESDFSLDLCGKDRPGHFDGVLTVVMKLLNLVRPTQAFFGEKDFQQLSLITEMVHAFFLSCEIVPVPTVREVDGLAMSSRNTRLTAEEREKAPMIYKIISSSVSSKEAFQRLEKENFKVDYVKDLRGRRFVAAHLGDVRLIDNVSI
jgi:pantoate--beta-alanine ligase